MKCSSIHAAIRRSSSELSSSLKDATTIVFDKTGTLTKAKPVVSDVVSFSEELSSDELLRIAACMEEHSNGRCSNLSSIPSGITHFSSSITKCQLREEAADAVRELKEAGITKVVMMTGDSERTAAAIAKRVGVDEYYSEVLPEDKASFVEKEKELGHKVIMIGDGINDYLQKL